MKLTRLKTHISLFLTSTTLVVGSAAFAQLGQSEWQTPGASSGSAGNASQGMGQSDWQTPSGSSGAGGGGLSQSGWQTPSGSNDSGGGLSQSGWQQPAGQQQAQQQVQQQQFQQPVQQQQQPQQVGQSDWQTPSSGNQVTQSGWQQPGQSQPLQGNATTSTTLGDALKSGQASNSASSDIDPAAAAMMMSQLNGGANGAGMPGAAANPAAMMGGQDPMASMAQQFAPALGALMMVMPSNNNGMGMPSSRPFTGGFAVPARAGTVYSNNNNNGGGIGSTVGKIVPPRMMQNMVRQMMYQGMSRAMYH